MSASLPDASTGVSLPATAGMMLIWVPVGGGAAEAVEEADVVVADVDVHEAADLARVVEHPGLDAAVVGLEVVEHLGRAWLPSAVTSEAPSV